MLQLSFHTCCVVSFVSFFFFVFFALFAVRNFLVACSVCVLWNGESSVDRRLRLKKEVRTNMRFVWFASQVKLYSNWKLRIRSRKKSGKTESNFIYFCVKLNWSNQKLDWIQRKSKIFCDYRKRHLLKLNRRVWVLSQRNSFVCFFLRKEKKTVFVKCTQANAKAKGIIKQ